MQQDLIQELELIQARKREAFSKMEAIIAEQERVIHVAANAGSILSDLEESFSVATKLTSVDYTFVALATVLLCAKQELLSGMAFRFKSDAEGNRIKKHFSDDITGPVPYDAFMRAEGSDVSTSLSGVNHRVKALGHDPMLGWIFGVANILTDTVTVNGVGMKSYNTVLMGGQYKITTPTSIASVLGSTVQIVTESPELLVKAVQRHAIHLGSDAFTKMGLPIPVINSLSPELSLFMLRHGMDLYGVTRGYVASKLIDLLVSAIHGLFSGAKTREEAITYSVRTQKVLMLANTLATTENVVRTAITRDLTRFDLGGLLATVTRLSKGYCDMMALKEKYVFGSFEQMILGDSWVG